MHLSGKPVASFDPEGLIFSVGVESKMVKLYDLRSFDKVCTCDFMTTRDCPRCNYYTSTVNLSYWPPPESFEVFSL